MAPPDQGLQPPGFDAEIQVVGPREESRGAGIAWIPRPVALLRALLVTAFAVTAGTAVLLGDVPYAATVDHALYVVVLGLGAVLVVLRPVLIREERLGWALIAIGVVCYSLADVLWLIMSSGHGSPTPSPWPNSLRMAFYVLLALGALLLYRWRGLRLGLPVLLDAIVGGLGVVTVVAALLLGPLLHAEDVTPILALLLIYAAADMLLLVLLLGALVVTPRRAPEWLALLTAGLTCLLTSDLLRGRLAEDLGQDGTWGWEASVTTGLLWGAALVLMALAGWVRVRPPDQPARCGSRVRLVLPIAATLLAVGTLVVNDFIPVGTPAVVLAAVTIVGALVRMSLAFRDVERLSESRTEARTDDLTGLPNRRRLRSALARMVAGGRPGALLMVDLDGFKEVNDTLGHEAGDDLLIQVARRLGECVRGDDLLTRLGGDEFALLAPDCDDGATALRVADRLRAALEGPFRVQDTRVRVDASVGAVLFPTHATTPSELLRRCDIAMYEAKSRRGASELYSPDLDAAGRDRFAVLEQLRTAFAQNEFVVHYQPLCDLQDGRAVAVEALVRWQHPVRGLLAPAEFLKVAEQAGLLRRLTLVVLRDALAECRRWRELGVPVRVAVNLSASALRDERIVADVSARLRQFGLPPQSLELEITEDLLVGDMNRAVDVLKRLRRLGLGITVDDFGTGYSSLAYLIRLPVQALKLDRSLIAPLRHDPRALAIARAVLVLAHDLGLRAVAEGVADREALAMLQELGYDVAQGFVLARPMPADEVTAWLLQNREGGHPLVPAQRRSLTDCPDAGHEAGWEAEPQQDPG